MCKSLSIDISSRPAPPYHCIASMNPVCCCPSFLPYLTLEIPIPAVQKASAYMPLRPPQPRRASEKLKLAASAAQPMLTMAGSFCRQPHHLSHR